MSSGLTDLPTFQPATSVSSSSAASYMIYDRGRGWHGLLLVPPACNPLPASQTFPPCKKKTVYSLESARLSILASMWTSGASEPRGSNRASRPPSRRQGSRRPMARSFSLLPWNLGKESSPGSVTVGGSLRRRDAPHVSGDKLLAAFVDDDQGIHRTDSTRVNQPLPVNARGTLGKGADILAVECENLRPHFHAVGSADTERTIDANRQAADFSFDEIVDGCSSVSLVPRISPLKTGLVRVSPLRTSWRDPTGDRRRPRLWHP